MLEQKYNRNLIALLLDKYFIKLHYCSNIFIFLINILVYVHDKNCIVIILILYCILPHWHVLNISVYAFWIHSRGVYVLYVCLCLLSFVKEQSILLIAQDQNNWKKQRNKPIKWGENEAMQSKEFVLFNFIFSFSFCPR